MELREKGMVDDRRVVIVRRVARGARGERKERSRRVQEVYGDEGGGGCMGFGDGF